VDHPIAVVSYRTRLEAEVAAAVLAANGLPYVIQSGEGAMYGPLPRGTSILVRASDVELARELLGRPREEGRGAGEER
jgi:hypothetical protein